MTYAQRKRTAERRRKAAPPRGGKTELENRDERPAQDELDDALLMSFPASDPIAISSPTPSGKAKPLHK